MVIFERGSNFCIDIPFEYKGISMNRFSVYCQGCYPCILERDSLSRISSSRMWLESYDGIDILIFLLACTCDMLQLSRMIQYCIC